MFYFLKIQTAFLVIIVVAPCVSKLKGPESEGPAATEHHMLTSMRMAKQQ